jgi:hypothetical protein
MRGRRGSCKVLVGNLRDFEEPEMNGRTILKRMLKETRQKDFDWIHVALDREMAGCSEYRIKPSSYTKCGEYLEQLSNYKLFNKKYAVWSE